MTSDFPTASESRMGHSHTSFDGVMVFESAKHASVYRNFVQSRIIGLKDDVRCSVFKVYKVCAGEGGSRTSQAFNVLTKHVLVLHVSDQGVFMYPSFQVAENNRVRSRVAVASAP